jgi:hypothetical protein
LELVFTNVSCKGASVGNTTRTQAGKYVTSAVVEFEYVASRSGHFNLMGKKRGGCSDSIVFLVSRSFPSLAATILLIKKSVWIYRPLLTGRHV